MHPVLCQYHIFKYSSIGYLKILNGDTVSNCFTVQDHLCLVWTFLTLGLLYSKLLWIIL